MTGLSTLHQRIAALGADAGAVRTRDRTIVAIGSGSALEALLQEIEETRFQRLLTFQNNRLEQLTLLVVSGRVIKVADPTSEALLANFADLKDIALADADHSGKRNFGAVITAFLHDTEQITVRPSLPPQNCEIASIGLALDCAFFDDLKAERGDSSDDTGISLEDYASQIRAVASAYVRLDGHQITLAQGAAPYLDRLVHLAEDELSSRVTEDQGQIHQEHFVLMSTAQHDGQSAICAAIGATVLFVTFPASKMLDVLALWSECRHRSGRSSHGIGP